MPERTPDPGSGRANRRGDDAAGGHDPQEPVSLTSVPEPRGDEQARRWHGYVIQMTVRIGCFVAALFTHGPLQLALIVGAVVLPYTAVIFANASGERRSTAPATVELPALPATPDVPAPRVIDQPIDQPIEQPADRTAAGDAPDGPGAPDTAPHGPDDASGARDGARPGAGASGSEGGRPAAGGTEHGRSAA